VAFLVFSLVDANTVASLLHFLSIIFLCFLSQIDILLSHAHEQELESPFKISGLSANPFLYNVTKMIVLSAFSAVLTEMLGFKLKLYKLKFKA
jgi:hypothetical protein